MTLDTRISDISLNAYGFGGGTTCPMTEMPACEIGDVLVACASIRSGTLNVTPTGWTAIGNWTLGIDVRLYAKIATSTAESLTLERTTTSTSAISCVVATIKNVDVSGGLAAAFSFTSTVATTTAEWEYEAASGITTADDNLEVLHFVVTESSLALPLTDGPTLRGYAYNQNEVALVEDFYPTSGATVDTFTVYKNALKSGGSLSVGVKIDPDYGGSVRWKSNADHVMLFGPGSPSRETQVVISTTLPAFTTVASIPVVESTSTPLVSVPNLWWHAWYDPAGQNLLAATYPNGALVGLAYQLLNAPFDLTGALVEFANGYSNANIVNSRQVIGTIGGIVVFFDASKNWAAYCANQITQQDPSILYHHVWPLDQMTKVDGSENHSGSAVNLADITYVFAGYHRKNSVTNQAYPTWGAMSFHTMPDVVTGFLNDEGVTTKDLSNQVVPLVNVVTSGVPSVYPQRGHLGSFQGSAQLVLRRSTQFGDGASPTKLKLLGCSIEFPAYDPQLAPLVDNCLELSFYPADGDVFDWSGGILRSPTRQTLKWHGSSSSSFTFDCTAVPIVGWDVEWLTAIPCAGALFSACYTVDGKSADFIAATFNSCQLTSGAYLALDGGASIDYSDAPTVSSSFTRGTEDYAIECRTAGYYDFSDSTFSGYTTEIYVSAMSGDVYIQLAEGQTVPSYDQAGGSTAVVHLVVPTVVADISITSMPTAVGAQRRLQIINTTATAASAWQASTSYTLGNVVLRTAGVGSENTAGLYMRCTSAGTSGGTEPTWDTTVGNTTTDNTVTWTTYAVLFYDADPAASSYSTTYVDGEEFLAGEEVEIRCAEMDGSTSFKTYSTTVVAATTGFSALVSEESDTVFATYALDGSAYDTTFSPNYAANYIVLDTNTDFSGASAYAYYCWLLTTTDGMYRFWGGLTALDTGNIRNNDSVISLYFDESAGFVKQTDNVRIFRNDGARPAIDPTTGGNGIEINWRVPVNVVSTGGSALTTEEHDHLMSRPSAATIANEVVNVTIVP